MYGPGAFCTAAASDDELGLAARGLCTARPARGTPSRVTAAWADSLTSTATTCHQADTAPLHDCQYAA